jgi:RNA-binding protein
MNMEKPLTTLSPAERSVLRARAHPLHPVVLIGDQGLSDAVIAEIGRSLLAHELIKIRVAGASREIRDEMLARICTELDAAPVQHIGKILVLYRPRPEDAGAKPLRKPRKTPRLPKRAYQNR